MMHSTCNQHGTSVMATTPGAVFANFAPILPLFHLGFPQLLVAIFAIGWHTTFQKLKIVAWQCQTGPLFWPKEAHCALFLVLGPPWGQQSPNLQITGPPSRATPSITAMTESTAETIVVIKKKILLMFRLCKLP